MRGRDRLSIVLLVTVPALLLAGCGLPSGSKTNGGTAWGKGAFRSNGERIYFTATSDRGSAITYKGGPGSSGWMIAYLETLP